MYKTIIFDVDSTLCTIEGIDELARMKGVLPQIAPLTQMTMEGKLSLEDVFSKRLLMIKPSKQDLEKVGELYCQSFSPHAKEVIADFKQENKDMFIISGGYREALLPLANFLGIAEDHVFTNSLLFEENGEYKDFDHMSPLWKENGKKKLIESLSLQPKTLLIGDGVSDLEAKDSVDLFVGYGGVQVRQKVKDEAERFIYDLRDLKKSISNT